MRSFAYKACAIAAFGIIPAAVVSAHTHPPCPKNQMVIRDAGVDTCAPIVGEGAGVSLRGVAFSPSPVSARYSTIVHLRGTNCPRTTHIVALQAAAIRCWNALADEPQTLTFTEQVELAFRGDPPQTVLVSAKQALFADCLKRRLRMAAAVSVPGDCLGTMVFSRRDRQSEASDLTVTLNGTMVFPVARDGDTSVSAPSDEPCRARGGPPLSKVFTEDQAACTKGGSPSSPTNSELALTEARAAANLAQRGRLGDAVEAARRCAIADPARAVCYRTLAIVLARLDADKAQIASCYAAYQAALPAGDVRDDRCSQPGCK